MSKETSMEHSAEWYRGAVSVLEEVATSYPVSLMTYRRLLAEAEAREAGEREAAGVGDLFNDISYSEGGGYDQGDVTEALYKAYELGANSLAEQLAAAQAEAKERTTMAARAQEAMRYLLNGLHANDVIWAAYGNADSARAWLAARDARMKALGAAEALRTLNARIDAKRNTMLATWGSYTATDVQAVIREELQVLAEAERLAEVE